MLDGPGGGRLRVIAGEFRGRRLAAPEGRGTRPILDRQKEALFNILRDRFPCSGVLDLFAGSGALGIEALSRGAERAVFVESSRRARLVLQKNLDVLALGERTRVLSVDAFALDPGILRQRLGVVFLDPPFPEVPRRPEDLRLLLERLARAADLEDEALVVLRLPSHAPVFRDPEGLRRRDERVMGESRILFLERVE